MAKRSPLTAVQDGRSARATQACMPRRKKNWSRQHAHTLCEWSARTTNMRIVALSSSVTYVPVHEVFLHPADVAHVQVTEKAIPRRAWCAWSLCSGCTSACHVWASSYEDLLTKTRWPLCNSPHAPSSAANQTWRQKRPNPNPAATGSAWSPANMWCLFASSLFVKTLGLLLVVPRPFPCHEPAEPVAKPVWRSCPASRESCPASANLAAPVRETVANCCGQPHKNATVKDLTIANYCVQRHPNYPIKKGKTNYCIWRLNYCKLLRHKK